MDAKTESALKTGQRVRNAAETVRIVRKGVKSSTDFYILTRANIMEFSFLLLAFWPGKLRIASPIIPTDCDNGKI